MKLSENIELMVRATRGVRLRIAVYIFCGVLSVAASLLLVYITKSLVDMVTRGTEIDSRLNLYIIALIGAILFQQLLVVVKGRVSNYASTTLMTNLRLELFDRVIRSEWSGKEQRHTGDLVNRIESDSRTLGEVLCVTLPSICVTVVQFIASFRFLHILDSRLSWIVALIMPFSLLLSKRYLLNMRRLTKEIRDSDSSLQSHIQEQIQNRNIINTIGDSQNSVERLESLSGLLLTQTMRRVNYTLFSRTIVQLGFGAGYVAAIVWGVYGLQSGAVTFGMMTAFLQLVSQVQRPAVDFATEISTAAKGFASVERLGEIYALECEERGEKVLLDGRVGLRVTDLNFEYSDGGGRKILERFSYDFEPNSLHVIVGKTGVGKSTLIRLMLGLLKPQHGALRLYNGVCSEECSAATRANLIYVPQGNTLMSGTVRQNLLLAKPDASEQELREALRVAVAEFVYDLPQALDTLLGERGAGVSEGEAQRIAIARGLLQSGSVMLLDEPTSALDSHTEKLLIERLAQYAKNRTLIMVTHRDTAAQLCASVVRLK